MPRNDLSPHLISQQKDSLGALGLDHIFSGMVPSSGISLRMNSRSTEFSY